MAAVKLLAAMYEEEGDFKRAAFTLGSFRFEQYRQCSASVADKVTWYVNAAENWLECDETGSAGQQVKRAHAHVARVKGDLRLTLRFKTCYARVLDAERKFLEAAMHYKQLSQMGQGAISENDMMYTLELAVNCAILAKAGPSRSRVLAILYSDERAQHLHAYSLLGKMYLGRIVRPQEVKEFEGKLQAHQNAMMSSGITVLTNSIVEHNMLAASTLYKNIKFEQLALLLGVGTRECEKLASDMIEQGRMNAVIDQVESVIEFPIAGGRGAGSVDSSLAVWDGQIKDVCLVVNRLLEDISAKYTHTCA
jgi:COP9 signalosome complex subunit 4